jgi:hypothetical protein
MDRTGQHYKNIIF